VVAVSALAVPRVGDDVDVLTAALAYTAAGWFVIPVKRGSKHPGSVVGKGWQHLSSREPDQLVAWWAGTDHGIALHVGRSGGVVLDVDAPDKMPAVVVDAVEATSPPYQSTRSDCPRRGHYLFAQPAGRILGNGTGRLGGAWGEVRGRNGVIVVAPSVHENAADGGRYWWGSIGPVPVLPSPWATCSTTPPTPSTPPPTPR